jgi:hypothetical protein
MALDRTLTEGDADLRPSRWPPRIGVGPALRWALAAALLVVAFGLLHVRGSSCAGHTSPVATTGPGSAGADPTHTAVSAGSGDQTAAASPTAAGAGTRRPSPGTAQRPPAVPAGTVGVPVRLAEPAALAVARPGIRVDLLAVAGGNSAVKPTVVANRALVLAVLTEEDSAGALYLALKPDEARRAVVLPDTTRFAIIVQP